MRTGLVGEAEHRGYARKSASQGIALLAHAVNACNNHDTPYRYGDAEQARFMELARGIYDLIEHGRIEARAGALAQDDAGLQRFLRGVVG